MDSTFNLAHRFCQPVYRGSHRIAASVAQGIRFAQMTPLATMTLPILGAMAIEAFGSGPQRRTSEQVASSALFNATVIGILGLAAIGTVSIHDWYMGQPAAPALQMQPFAIPHQPRAPLRQNPHQSSAHMGG